MENRMSAESCAALLQTLVRTDTCQPAGNEEALCHAIAALFPDTVEKTLIPHQAGRASLAIRIPGKESRGGLAFMGHLDTVSCGDPSLWSCDPLAAQRKGDLIYGRGTADMKGGLVCMIQAALHLLESGKPLAHDLWLCFTADEEANGTGALAFAGNGWLKNIRALVVAEPSNEEIGLCEKGALWLRIKAIGALAHGSRPEIGINAVEKLMEFERAFRAQVPVDEIHPVLDRTTMAVTQLHGGIMTNVIPANGEMEIDMRTLPTVDHDQLLHTAKAICDQMMAQCPGLKLEIQVLNNRPAVEVAEEDPFVDIIKESCAQAGIQPHCKGLYFYTDASQVVPALGCPFVIFGPGADTMAHQIDERIDVHSMERVAKAYYHAMEKMCL